MFFSCHFSYNVWATINNWLVIQMFSIFSIMRVWLEMVVFEKIRYFIWVAGMWCLWLLRNKIIFQDGVTYYTMLVSHTHIELVCWS